MHVLVREQMYVKNVECVKIVGIYLIHIAYTVVHAMQAMKTKKYVQDAMDVKTALEFYATHVDYAKNAQQKMRSIVNYVEIALVM